MEFQIEYDPYLYYVEGNLSSDIANKINRDMRENPKANSNSFGLKARQFVFENKNSQVQAKKIVDMIENVITNEAFK